MPNTKISSLSVMTSAASGDLIPIVDISDLTMAATGTTKRVTQAVLSSSILASAQPLDATLTALAGLTIAADSLAIGTGADAFTQHTFIANTFPARASTGSLESKPITDFGLSLIDDAASSNARTTLGLGTIATQAASSVAITGGIIDGTTVGATVKSTGAFTSLSASTGASVTSSATNTNGLLVTGGSSLGTAVISSGEIKLGSDSQNYGLLTYNNQAGLVTLKNNYSAGEVHITAGTATVLEAEPAGLKAVAATTSSYGLVVTGGSPLNAPHAGSANIRLGTHATDYCYLDYNGSSANLVIGNNYSVGKISISTGASDRLTVLSTGNVGIGTTSPNAPLEVSKSSASIRISDTANNTGAGDVQSSLDLYGRYYSNDSVAYPVAKIAAIHQETNGTGGGVLAFSTQSAGFLTVAERMRIDKSGIVGIGTTSPNVNALLDVTSTTKAFMPPRMTTTQKNAIASPTAGMVVYDSTLNKLCVRAASAWETITSV